MPPGISGARKTIAVMGIAAVCMAAASLGSTAQAALPTYPATVLADNPLAYWRLGETSGTTVKDEKGSATGTYVGTRTLGQPGALTGDPNLAASFNGANSYASIPYQAARNSSVFSVETWVFPTGGNGRYRGVVASRSYPRGWVLYATGNNTWSFWVNSGSGMVGIDGPAITLNTWTHLLATFDGTTGRLYVNGVLAASGTSTGYSPNRRAALTIGQGAPGDNFWFPGRIDEVSLYTQALSADKVKTHYAAGVGSVQPPATPTPPPSSTPPPTWACLGVQRYPEIRPTNSQWNNTAGKKPNPAYREWITGFGPYYDQIDGAGCVGGTTEQILEWAARKWRFDQIPGAGAELLKAVAVQESDWYERVQGDSEPCTQNWCFPSPGFYPAGYQTFGITGIKRTSWADSWPSSATSTAFAADYAAAGLRAYYDGAIPWAAGTKGNLIRAIGAWYCGCGDGGGDDYGRRVLATLASREWAEPAFATTACSTNCAP